MKGVFGYLKKEGSLYDISQAEEAELLWEDEKVDVTKEEAAVKVPFIKSLDEPFETSESTSFNLEDDVNSWVDYLLARFHPRTLNVIEQYKHDCTTSPFDVFTYGQSLWNTEQFSEDFSERIRAYVEECNSMQGFQVCI